MANLTERVKALRSVLISTIAIHIYLLPSFRIFSFANVISLSAGRHLLLFQFPNLHVSVKPPISLLSVVSKTLERHFHQYITNHLNEYHPLSNKQWDFQSGKSTATALLSVTHDWFQALKLDKKCVPSFFYLTKAFDFVPHRLLVDKLTSLGLDAHTISWITSYLTNRKHHVVVGGKSSQDASVLSRVSQGSVLGPLLFLVYIDDVSNILLSDGSILNLYADDMLLYKSMKSFEDYSHLQLDIDCIY